MPNSFESRSTCTVGGRAYTVYRLSAVEAVIPQAKKLPFSLKILLENLLRNENGLSVRKADIEALARWNPTADPDTEIAYTPARCRTPSACRSSPPVRSGRSPARTAPAG